MIKNVFKLLTGSVPGQLIIQFTDHCNAKCPQCGMRKTSAFERSTLTGEHIVKSINAAVTNGFQAISFTGGEPLLFLDDLVGYIKYAGNAGLEYIRTGTNGFIFMGSEKSGFEDRIKRTAEKLADTRLRNFWISIDSSVPEIHESMRGFPGVIRGIEKALPIFHDFGIFPSANLGINRNLGGDKTPILKNGPEKANGSYYLDLYGDFLEGFGMFYNFVINMGFTMVNTCYPMSIDPDEEQDLNAVYAATSTDSIVSFTNAEKAVLFKSLLQAVDQFRSRIRIFSPETSLYSLYRDYETGAPLSYPCRGGIDFFFIDSRDGDAYPCGYRGGDNLGKFWDVNVKKLKGEPHCRKCDWECFRDPSELFAPFLMLTSSPIGLLKKIKNDSAYFRYWLDDLAYYRACDYFNGRKPMDIKKMSGVSGKEKSEFQETGTAKAQLAAD